MIGDRVVNVKVKKREREGGVGRMVRLRIYLGTPLLRIPSLKYKVNNYDK